MPQIGRMVAVLLRISLLGCLWMCLLGSSCQPDIAGLLPTGDEAPPPDPAGVTLMARFVHVTDSHVVDPLSPARFPGIQSFVPFSWRPWEAYSTQVFDGIIRTTNAMHAAGRTIDFVLHTGDAIDNAQANELAWFVAIMDGGTVNPLSGPDDRLVDARPTPLLDPYAPFEAQGLYQFGIHGDRPTILWYGLMGNHEIFCGGAYPIVRVDDRKIAPLPLNCRPGFVLPVNLDPLADIAYGPVSPAHPGPPPLLSCPVPVQPNSERAFISSSDFIRAMRASPTQPSGHGFGDGDHELPYYSVLPIPGLRLIGLLTSDIPAPIPAFISYSKGCISAEQLAWFRSELEQATANGEKVIVATHHRSGNLETLYGSVVGPGEFRDLLNQYPAVILHLNGHEHTNRVWQRGHYLEISTCGTIDWPQEARVIELWQDNATGEIIISYDMFSHVDDRWPMIGDDLLRPLREQALSMANDYSPILKLLLQMGVASKSLEPSSSSSSSEDDDFLANPAGTPTDRTGQIRVP